MFTAFLAFTFSLLITLALVPVLSSKAARLGLVDKPDQSRKLHLAPIPMVGGVSIYFAISAVLLGTMAIMFLNKNILATADGYFISLFGYPQDMFALRRITQRDATQYLGLFLGASMLLAIGVLDDRVGIRGRQKLLGQIVATTILISFGFKFDVIRFANIRVSFDMFSIILVYGWVLASVNSVNLLDGADGIAATIGIVMSGALAVMLLCQGKIIDGVAAATIMGALVGFLKYNFPPAKVYLGDAGSMLIGFLLSALAIRCTIKQNSFYAFLAPVALLAIPFIDTGAAIIRRRLTGRSIFAVDRGHLHHKLIKRGYSPRMSLLWVALLCSMTAVGGTMALLFAQAEYAVIAILCVIIVMVACRIFGWAEFELVAKRGYSFAKTLVPGALEKQTPLTTAVHVQGDRSWDGVWSQLCEFSEHYELLQLVLDVNAPWLHESFHAKFKSQQKVREANYIWSGSVPLVVDGRVFGKIDFRCSKDAAFNHHQVFAGLLELTEGIEQSVSALSAKPVERQQPVGVVNPPENPDVAT